MTGARTSHLIVPHTVIKHKAADKLVQTICSKRLWKWEVAKKYLNWKEARLWNEIRQGSDAFCFYALTKNITNISIGLSAYTIRVMLSKHEITAPGSEGPRRRVRRHVVHTVVGGGIQSQLEQHQVFVDLWPQTWVSASRDKMHILCALTDDQDNSCGVFYQRLVSKIRLQCYLENNRAFYTLHHKQMVFVCLQLTIEHLVITCNLSY